VGPDHHLDETLGQPNPNLGVVGRLDLEEKAIFIGVILDPELMKA